MAASLTPGQARVLDIWRVSRGPVGPLTADLLLTAPSPAATASISIGRHIAAELAEEQEWSAVEDQRKSESG